MSFFGCVELFVDLVFFHLIPEDGEVVAVSDLCFQILYRIFRALFAIFSLFFVIWLNGVWKVPNANCKSVSPVIGKLIGVIEVMLGSLLLGRLSVRRLMKVFFLVLIYLVLYKQLKTC
jgi:hypothetical protein